MAETDYAPTMKLRWRVTNQDERWHGDPSPALHGGRESHWYVLEQWWQKPLSTDGEWRKIEVVA